MITSARLFVILIVVVASFAGLDGGPLAAGPRPARTRRGVRVVVYLGDTTAADHLDEARLQRSADICARRGWQPAAIIREEPGETTGLTDALRMVRDGEADRIVMASGAELPDVLESDTGSIGPWVRARAGGTDRYTGLHRRIRPTRRVAEGA